MDVLFDGNEWISDASPNCQDLFAFYIDWVVVPFAVVPWVSSYLLTG
jgi:hypothetical protein